jgi:hypothetical protein
LLSVLLPRLPAVVVLVRLLLLLLWLTLRPFSGVLVGVHVEMVGRTESDSE